MYSLRMIALLAVTLTAAYAQTTGSATIVGTVSDNTGAVIPGVKISIVSPTMGFNFTAETNAEGYYLVPYLRPGAYNMTVESKGFKKISSFGN